ncbi:hypothetical protein OG21DRAFT_1130970 [Imleria badia]|nr:hypothetical protein OG21DRAFT_1130970 [Imleria badia]
MATPDQSSEPRHSVSEQDEDVTMNNMASWTQHPSRTHRLPLRYRDELPEAPPPISTSSPIADGPSLVHRVILHVFDSIRTCFNTFGIARDYRHRPTYDPDSFVSVHDLSDLPRCPDVNANSSDPITSSSVHSPPWP